MNWSIVIVSLCLAEPAKIVFGESTQSENIEHTNQTLGLKGMSEDFADHLRTLDNSTTNQTFDSLSIRNITPIANLEKLRGNMTDPNIGMNCTQVINGTVRLTDGSMDAIVSKETSTKVRFVVNLVLLPLISIPGCVCNVFNVFILTRGRMRNSTHCYLTGLSIADMFYLFFVIAKWIFYLVENFNKALYQQIMLSMYHPILDYFLMLAAGGIANVLILVISVERFIAVKFPLKAKLSPITRHPVKINVAVYMFVVVILTPTLFKYRFAIRKEECSNVTALIFEKSDLFWAHEQFYGVFLYFQLVALRLVPVFFVFILNCCIILVLIKSRRRMTTTNIDVRQKEDLKVTRMLLTIAAIFIVCVFPGFLHSMFQGFLSTYVSDGRYRNLWTTIFTIYPLLDAMNATANFIVTS